MISDRWLFNAYLWLYTIDCWLCIGACCVLSAYLLLIPNCWLSILDTPHATIIHRPTPINTPPSPWLLIYCCWLLAHWLLRVPRRCFIVDCLLLIADCGLPTFNYCEVRVTCCVFIINGLLSNAYIWFLHVGFPFVSVEFLLISDCLLLGVTRCLLIADHKLSIAHCFVQIIGCWLLAVDYWLLNDYCWRCILEL